VVKIRTPEIFCSEIYSIENIGEKRYIFERFNKLAKMGDIGALFARVVQYSFCQATSITNKFQNCKNIF